MLYMGYRLANAYDYGARVLSFLGDIFTGTSPGQKIFCALGLLACLVASGVFFLTSYGACLEGLAVVGLSNSILAALIVSAASIVCFWLLIHPVITMIKNFSWKKIQDSLPQNPVFLCLSLGLYALTSVGILVALVVAAPGFSVLFQRLWHVSANLATFFVAAVLIPFSFLGNLPFNLASTYGTLSEWRLLWNSRFEELFRVGVRCQHFLRMLYG